MTGQHADDADTPIRRGVWRLPLVRVTAIVGAVSLVIAVGAGVWAAAWSEERPTLPGFDTPVDEPVPAPGPSTDPVPPTPTEQPAPPPESDPAPDPEVLPPAPVVSSPADGALGNDPHPSFSGTGEPGFHVYVQLVDPATGRAWTIADGRVANDGSWDVRSATRLSDGPHEVLILQVDLAGNLSAAVHRAVVVDTTVLSPTVDEPAAGPHLLLPELSGTGEPGAVVTVRDDAGAVLGTAGVASEGVWRLALPDPGRDGATLTATQTDAAGNVSSASSATAPLVFARPAVGVDSPVPSDGEATDVDIVVSGAAGARVEVAVDGVPIGPRVDLGAGSVVVSIPALAEGEHRIAVRYRDGGRAGSWAAVTVLVAPATPTPTPTP